MTQIHLKATEYSLTKKPKQLNDENIFKWL